jgi:hypothetical protein
MFSCLVCGVCSLAVLASMPAILPTWASPPTAVTSMTPLPYGGDEQDDLHVAAVLLEEPPPPPAPPSPRHRLHCRKRVGTVLSEPLRGLRRLQPADGVHPEALGHILGGEGMWNRAGGYSTTSTNSSAT